MFNLYTRIQTLLNKAVTSASIIAAIIAAIAYTQLVLNNVWQNELTSVKNIVPSAAMRKSFYAGSVNRNPKENSAIKFDLNADLSPLFNWNTKLVFVYLTAEYPGKSPGSSNKVTYWDKIITSKDKAKILLKNYRSKYSVWDVEKSFRERDAVLKLEWNIQPWVGPLVYGETSTNTTFTFAKV